MPKSELNVPNSDGLTYRNTVNSALQSLASMQAGSGGATSIGTLPATTYENQLFYDASDGKIKQKQAGSWVVIGDRAENWGLATKAAPAFTGAATFSGSVSITATSFFQLPSGTDAQRPGSPAAGMLRWNSEQARFEGYYGSTWDVLTTSLPLADDSVTTPKILDGAVTKSKLASSVTDGQIKGRKLGMNLYNVYTRAVPYNNLYHANSSLSYDLIDTYGRGNIRTTSFGRNEGGSFISTNGDVFVWGTSSHTSISPSNYTLYEPTRVGLRQPKWLHELYFGDPSLNTLDTKVMPMGAASPRESFSRRTGNERWSVMFESGNTYSANMGYPYPKMPKIVEHYPFDNKNFYLTENGCLFAVGYSQTTSIIGNGWSGTNVVVPTEVQFFDTNGTHLSGTSKPKIIQFACTCQGASGIAQGLSYTNFTYYALDNLGNVYSWGSNTYGQLGINSTGGSQHYAKRIDPVRFGNEPVFYITAGGTNYGHAFAITGTGKCYGWGANSYGQLGTTDTNDRPAPESLTTMNGNNLYQKTVVHVVTTDWYSSSYPQCHTLFLTSTGEVFAAGYARGHGEYIGVYQSTANQNITNPTKLTDHPAANEKVLSVYLFGSSHIAQSYLITEGSGGRRLAYSFGNNATGQLGRTTATTSPASASGQFANGTSDESWFCRQIKYRDYGDTELATSAVTGANETIGYSNELSGGSTIWYGSQAGTQWRPMGNPCAFFCDSDGYYNYSTVVMIDSRGTCWTCGQEVLNQGVNMSSRTNSTGGSAYEWYFARWLQQPEQGVGFMFNSYNTITQSYTFLGESGTVYVGGYNSSYAMGKPYNNGYYPVTPLAITSG